ncbi:Gfo/Idh/MocA family protein [Vallitalea okinawensis]|uniref:Gfo/Idh/MocA family protein n=1 Tax=Vallitalea okinawensis TaxID=2078660 RepID=UPI000CFDFA20|nr:Gfo/Idh/MocA family oxidoreductase [Vallitalea okinawensis]
MKMKIGVLGVSGHFFLRCCLPLQHSNQIEVYAIASRNKEKAKKASKEWNIPVFYDSYDQLLQDKKIEAVYIPLPNHMHAEWIKKCADAGKHIICEKPLALDADEAKVVAAYVKERNVKLMEAFMYRFHPKWNRAKEIVKTGGIGRVTAIHSIFTYNNKDSKNIRNIKAYGGGALYDIGCYAISTARYLLDEEPRKVIALAEEDQEFSTDVLTSGILDFGTARCLFTVGTQTSNQQEVTIYGTGGKITVTIPFNDFPDVKGNIIVETGLGKRKVEFDPVDQYRLEFEAFASAIKNDSNVPITPEESIKNIHVMDAVRESYETGKWIKL